MGRGQTVKRMTERGFVIPSFLLSPTVIIVAAVIGALSISNVLLFKLWKGEVKDHATYIAQVDAAQAEIADRNAARVREADEATRAVVEGWDRAVRDLGRDYVSRLRSARRDCAGVPAATTSASGADEATADAGSGAATFETACLTLERDCAKTTGQLLWLQNYIERVCR
jgi:hypothetical protein